LTFSGTGKRILGDFNSSPIANRTMFQTTGTNASTNIYAIPNGTATTASFSVANNSDASNSAILQVVATATEHRIQTAVVGTGSHIPITFYTSGVERLRIPVDAAGITFPATQAASSDPNTLDDYEEGTAIANWWAQSGSTFVDVRVAARNEQGGYTKIGNKVTYWTRLQHDNSYNSAYAGYQLSISLPFPISSSKYNFDSTKGPRIGTANLASSTASYRSCWLYGVPGSSVAQFNLASDNNNFLYSYWGTGGGQVSSILVEYFTD
jgi:hypothetical protein